MYYSLCRPILFHLQPETAHRITLRCLQLAHALGISQNIPSLPREVMGLTFPNPIGLAAGLDKNGDYVDALAALGFGFIEVGTVTPKPQVGNALPRVFRLPKHRAILNRLGFNNKGADYLVEQLKNIQYQGILGINIGKNHDTPNSEAVNDYLHMFRRVALYASYVAINISSPNTQALRELQHGSQLHSLLVALKQEQAVFFDLHKKYVPLVVKIAPDLIGKEIDEIAETLLTNKIDGVIATNTTTAREGVENSEHANEAGGLSGEPLRSRSTKVVHRLFELLQNQIPIIACGGILSAEDAAEKFAAGASLIQLYSGLIYEGPGLIADIAVALTRRAARQK